MSESPYLSLIVPTYNEKARIFPTLQQLQFYFEKLPYSYEIYVIDDGSTDNTFVIVKDFAKSWPQLKPVYLKKNLGKGKTIKWGMLNATGKIRAFTDADLATPIEELPKLLAPLQEKAQISIGSRALKESIIATPQPFYRIWMGKVYNFLVRLLVLPDFKDTQCGFKAYTAEAAKDCFYPLQTARFGFDAEVLLRAKKKGYQIAEVPVVWNHVENSRVVTLKDSLITFVDLIKLRFTKLSA